MKKNGNTFHFHPPNDRAQSQVTEFPNGLLHHKANQNLTAIQVHKIKVKRASLMNRKQPFYA